jgi:hypothetical protein
VTLAPPADASIQWLLDGDPAIRWQALRDLVEAPERIIKPAFIRFSFPPRWHYDILRALDYFQAVAAPRDPRLTDAIDIVESNRQEDGRWLLQHCYKGKTYFELERLGAPSRWNTLRALRVLKWWRE